MKLNREAARPRRRDCRAGSEPAHTRPRREEAEGLCDRIGIIKNGELAACKPTDELLDLFSEQVYELRLDRMPPPGPEAETCGPGPFSMADESTTRAKMEAAGFTDIAFERIDAKVNVGRDIEDAVCFQLAIGPAGETYRTAGEAGVARRAEIVIALSDLFEEVIDREGGLWMDSSSWLITARAPA